MAEMFAKLNDGRVYIVRGTDEEQEACQALTEHLEGKTGQLGLWDEPSKIEIIPFNLGDVCQFSTSWADGDTSPASLQRLATLQKEHLYYPGPLGSRLAARVLSTRIAEGRVYMKCQRVAFPITCVDTEDDQDVAD